MCRLAKMDDDQAAVRAEVRELQARSGLTLTQLARKAGVAASTLTRFVNSTDVKHTLSTRTLAALRRAASPQHEAPAPPKPPVASHPASAMATLARAAALEAIAGAGPRLRATRLALNLRTPAELAAEIGVSTEDVAGWEEGLPPDLAALAVLKLRRGVPLDWLLLGDDSALPPLLLHALVQGGQAGLAWRGGVPRGQAPEHTPDRRGGALHEERGPP